MNYNSNNSNNTNMNRFGHYHHHHQQQQQEDHKSGNRGMMTSTTLNNNDNGTKSATAMTGADTSSFVRPERTTSSSTTTTATATTTAQAEADRRRSDPQTYTTDIMSGLNVVKNLTQVTEFMSDFNKNLHMYENDFRQRHLQEYKTDLWIHYNTLVPSEVTHKQFLQRYFFRCGSLERIQHDLDRQEAERLDLQKIEQETKRLERERAMKQRETQEQEQHAKLEKERMKWGLKSSSWKLGLSSSSQHKPEPTAKSSQNNIDTKHDTVGGNVGEGGSSRSKKNDGSAQSRRVGGGGGRGRGGVQFRGVSNDDPNTRSAWESSEGAEINLKSLQPPTLTQRQSTKDLSSSQSGGLNNTSSSSNFSRQFLKPVLRKFSSFNASVSNSNLPSSTTTSTNSTTDEDGPIYSGTSTRPSWHDAGSRNDARTAPMVKPQRQLTGAGLLGPSSWSSEIPTVSSTSSSTGSLIDDDDDDDDDDDVDGCNDGTTSVENNRQKAMRHMNLTSSSSSVVSAPIGTSSATSRFTRPSTSSTTTATATTTTTGATTTNSNSTNTRSSGPPVTRRHRDGLMLPVRRNSARDLISKLERQSSEGKPTTTNSAAPTTSSSSSSSVMSSNNVSVVGPRRISVRRTSSFGDVSKNTSTEFVSKLRTMRNRQAASSESSAATTQVPSKTSKETTTTLPSTRRPLSRSSSFQYSRSAAVTSQTSTVASTRENKPQPEQKRVDQTTNVSSRPNSQIAKSSSSVVSAPVVTAPTVQTAPATEITVTGPPVTSGTSRISRFSTVAPAPGVVSSRLQGMYRNRNHRVRSSSVTPSLVGGSVSGSGRIVGRSDRKSQVQTTSNSNRSTRSLQSAAVMTAPVNTGGGGADVASVATGSFASLNHTVGGNGGTQADPLAVKSVVRANRRRQTVETYTAPLKENQEEDQDIEPYLKNFKMEQWKDAAAIALAMYPDSVAIHHQDLVVHAAGDDLDAVKESDFWCRYFYRCDEKRIFKDLRRRDKLGTLGESSRNLFGRVGEGGEVTTPIGMRIPMRIGRDQSDRAPNSISLPAKDDKEDEDDNDSTKATKNTGSVRPRVGSLKDKLRNWTKVTSAAAGNSGGPKLPGPSATTPPVISNTALSSSRTITASSTADRGSRRYRGRPSSQSFSGGGSSSSSTVVSAPIRNPSLSSYGTAAHNNNNNVSVR